MKPYNILIFFFLFSLVLSCQESPCKSNPKEIQTTGEQTVGSKLKDFGGCPKNMPCFSTNDLKGNFILIYLKKVFKKEDKYIPLVFSLNTGIENKTLWEAVKNKNGDIIVSNELKMAKSFGIKYYEDTQFHHNTLFITDKNKIITHIYIDICEEDIIKLVNEKL